VIPLKSKLLRANIFTSVVSKFGIIPTGKKVQMENGLMMKAAKEARAKKAKEAKVVKPEESNLVKTKKKMSQ
jgi:hypothetical protein